jgi:RNA polymerase sigma-70 factor (ECF subfamily)
MAVERDSLTRAGLELSDDGQLVGLTLRGDNRAYEILVRRYQKLVYNVLYHMLQNHESAADVTQDTFLRAYRGLSTFKHGSPFKPWLLRIATNTGLNKVRETKAREHDSLDYVMDEHLAAEPASRQDVEAEVEWRLSQTMLKDALLKLPARHRHVFLLRYQHDMSYADIATITEESETTIKSLLFRTRERLRKMLQDEMKVD